MREYKRLTKNMIEELKQYKYLYVHDIYKYDHNVIAFKCNKKVYEIGQFHKIFTFVVSVYLDDIENEKNPRKLFIPIYKTQPEETER